MATQLDDFWRVPEEQLSTNRTQFLDFLDNPADDANYRDIIERVVDARKPRVLVDLDHLRSYDRRNGTALARSLVLNPREYLQPLEAAVRAYARDVRTTAPGDLCVGVTGPIGDSLVSPRNLGSRFLSQIVCLDGIVTKTSLVNPKLLKSVQYCPETGQYVLRTFHDASSLTELPTRMAVQTTDLDGHALEMEFGASEFIDHQLLTIQERPETAPAGQMPRSCDVIADRDLADFCKPGDRVKIYGVYRIVTGCLTGNTTGVYRAVLIANNIEVGNQSTALDLSAADVANIEEVAKRDDVADLLARSLAPSICGQDLIKKALVLMLAGGVECNLADGTHIRGDINVLMVGDPSTAKSQLLRHILAVAPLAVHTNGRGSSGVGLTAAVSSDPETGERRLEAGAMVIADRGVVCIDEFDKMDETDRVAIHEALEQQTVTISKAGIHTSLHARCSVVAAANPVWGTYNANRSPMENVGLPSSLLSRFDLLFIVLDYHDPRIDATIADHVLRTHRWRGQAVEAGNGVFVQPDPLLHGTDEDTFLTIAFLKKFISYARQLRPALTEAARDDIVQEWAELRTIEGRKALPLTPRAFETLIRLATAHAKVRLSTQVTEEDSQAAIRLLRYAIFGEVEADGARTRSRRAPARESTESEESEEYAPAPKRRSRAPRRPRKPALPEAEAEPEPEMEDKGAEDNAADSDARQARLLEVFQALLKDPAVTTVRVVDLVERVVREKGFRPTDGEVGAFLDRLVRADKIMLDDSIIYPL